MFLFAFRRLFASFILSQLISLFTLFPLGILASENTDCWEESDADWPLPPILSAISNEHLGDTDSNIVGSDDTELIGDDVNDWRRL